MLMGVAVLLLVRMVLRPTELLFLSLVILVLRLHALDRLHDFILLSLVLVDKHPPQQELFLSKLLQLVQKYAVVFLEIPVLSDVFYRH